MKVRFFTGKIALISLLGLFLLGSVQAQQPRKESLLNGLKVVMIPDASSGMVWARIRVHSGSAFDPQGREGLMRMLASNIFPNEAAKEYFSEDLGGSLDVRTNYDFIELDVSAKPENLIQMLETLSGAISNPVIDKESTSKLRDEMLARVKQMGSDAALVADSAVSRRLFGAFPYGRSLDGTEESLKKIDFADLIDARNRFLTADNATLVLSGNFNSSRALQAVKRLFGGWTKSDRRVPSTFRQPDEPPAGVLTVRSPSSDGFEVRVAFRGTSRSAADMAAADVFARILESRLKARGPSALASGVSVRSDAYMLPGQFIIRYSGTKNDVGAKNGQVELDEILPKALSEAVTDAEFAAARSAAAAEWSKRSPELFLLDADTYNTSPQADREIYSTVTVAKVREFAAALNRRSPVTVVVTSAK